MTKLTPSMQRAQKALGGLTWRLGRRALRRGVGAAVEHRSLLRSRAWKSVVDIGANRGQFALAVRRYCPSAEVRSFEPLPGPAAIFRHIFAEVPAVRLEQVAIGPASGFHAMNVSARDDSSSLLAFAAEQVRLFPGTEPCDRIDVTVRPLHEVLSAADLPAPGLLKIDVQGFELQALIGCERLLPAFDAIYVECSYRELYVDQPLAPEVVAWLAERDFDLIGSENLVTDSAGLAVQADLLFERRTRGPAIAKGR